MSWKIDLAHSEINFAVRHMMISNVRGRFEKFTGTVDFNEANPSASQVEVQIEAASVNTRETGRDAHLSSVDFFDTEKYPYLTFTSKKVDAVDKNHGNILGDLTIRNITHPVVLKVDYSGEAMSPWGSTSAGFSASTVIHRKDWDLTWNKALETGGVLVGDEIKIDIDLEIVKQVEPKPAIAAG